MTHKTFKSVVLSITSTLLSSQLPLVKLVGWLNTKNPIQSWWADSKTTSLHRIQHTLCGFVDMYVLFYGDCCLLDSTFSSGIGLHHLPTREDDRVISFPIAYTYKQFSNALVYRGDSHISWKANQRSSRLPLMPSRLPLHMVRLGLIWTNQSCPTTGPQHVTKHSWLHGCQKLVLRCFAFLQYGYRLLRFPCLK